ncbi:hypothetical protein O0L34_g14867 [Tuta absoluta]|nr:hypothetical protein O0L34_g14867 [Tuta absoluta]
MDSPWNCCRMCLGVQNLFPIFHEADHHEIYTNVLFIVTGVKVEMSDSLPQQICSNCINFINESIKFRKQCEDHNTLLQTRLNEKQFHTVKLEITPQFKQENDIITKIDISHLLTETDNDFRDYDDNITLDSLKYNNISKTDEQVEFETEIDNSQETSQESSHNTENVKVKRKRTMRSKKENNDKNNHNDESKKEVKCEYCDKILTSKLSLRNHYKIHTGFDVVCEHCGKKFITRRLLLMHCRAKHGYEKTDKCSYCDYKASNAEQVKIHERLHTGEKPYACTQCDAAFHRKSSYLQHIAIHLPEKTVQCDQCPARFKSVTLMRIHRSRHRAASYSFQCRVCSGSFARRRNVARHLLRVHNLPPEQHHIDRRKIA